MESKIIIIGKAASGKDFLQKQLVLKGWIPLRLFTTRPIRPTENGDEYHFMSDEEFDSIRHKLMSVQTFNGWKYGFDIDEETRRQRLSVRYKGGNEDDSLERRLRADKEDFKTLDRIGWDDPSPDRFIRLCNNVEVDNFLKKLFT